MPSKLNSGDTADGSRSPEARNKDRRLTARLRKDSIRVDTPCRSPARIPLSLKRGAEFTEPTPKPGREVSKVYDLGDGRREGWLDATMGNPCRGRWTLQKPS